MGRCLTLCLLALLYLCGGARAQPADPLPSGNDGPSKARILAFVQAVTDAKRWTAVDMKRDWRKIFAFE